MAIFSRSRLEVVDLEGDARCCQNVHLESQLRRDFVSDPAFWWSPCHERVAVDRALPDERFDVFLTIPD